MPPIKNISDQAREIADTGQWVDPGKTVEVDDTLARSLAKQTDVWETPKSKSATAENKES